MTKREREEHLRNLAGELGYILKKSPARDPRDITYGGYQLCNVETGGADYGWGNANRGYALDLDEVEEILTEFKEAEENE